MPLAGWSCPICRRDVNLEHYKISECSKAFPPDYINAVLAGQNKKREGIHVSSVLGCPRSTAIEQAEPYFIDPMSVNSIESGTAWHSHMEAHSADPKNTEVKLSGFIAGILVTGTADRLLPEELVLADWKNHGDFSKKYVKAEGAKLAHQAQVSIYADLCEQQLKWRPITGRIWHHFSSQGADSIIVSEFDIWPIEKVLAYHPHDGAYSVRELLMQANSALNPKSPILHTWNALPLAGETMMFGQKTMCEYCGVRGVCKTAATGAPF